MGTVWAEIRAGGLRFRMLTTVEGGWYVQSSFGAGCHDLGDVLVLERYEI